MRQSEVIVKIMDKVYETSLDLYKSPVDPYDFLMDINDDISIIFSFDTAVIGVSHEPTIFISFCLKRINKVLERLEIISPEYDCYVATIVINPWDGDQSVTTYPWIEGEDAQLIMIKEIFTNRYFNYFDPIIKKYSNLKSIEQAINENSKDLLLNFVEKAILASYFSYINSSHTFEDTISRYLDLLTESDKQKLFQLKHLILTEKILE